MVMMAGVFGGSNRLLAATKVVDNDGGCNIEYNYNDGGGMYGSDW